MKLKEMKLQWLEELGRFDKCIDFEIFNESLISKSKKEAKMIEKHYEYVTEKLDVENENSMLQKFRENVSKVENFIENLSEKVEKLEMDENHMCDQEKVKRLQRAVIFNSMKVNEFINQNLKLSKLLTNQINHLQERIYLLEIRQD